MSSANASTPSALPPHSVSRARLPSNAHLASITPAETPPRVLSLFWKLWGNFCILITPLAMIALALVLSSFSMFLGIRAGAFVVMAAVLASVVAQLVWAWTYPEWPINQWSLARLRKGVLSRSLSPDVRLWVENARMVEWVPRDAWKATRLDTAADVMLIHVDRDGVHMEGDRSRYHFPPGSIIDVSTESVRPSGCFHYLHFVVLVVRTEDGPMEFPLSYRDHPLGQLRSSKRQQQAAQLCADVASIATGGDFSYGDPAHLSTPRPKRSSENPFAAPRSV